MTKAFAYLRVSGKGQVKGDGFPRQLAAVREYARAHNIEIVQVFEERGVCGALELENRPALMAMLEALASDGIKLVLIEMLNRLARDLMVQETLIADLRKRGFELISVMEPDLLENDPSRIMMRQIFGAVAQYEKAMLVAKLRGARERERAKDARKRGVSDGRCEGRKPFGERAGEQAAIARMKELRAGKMSFAKIAAVLNAEGYKSRQGKARGWRAYAVDRILSREA